MVVASYFTMPKIVDLAPKFDSYSSYGTISAYRPFGWAPVRGTGVASLAILPFIMEARMALSPQEARAAFLRSFNQLAPYKHRYDVWRDFVIMAACALHNGFHKDPAREEEYLEIIKRYKPADQKMFPELLAGLIAMLEPEPSDVLGQIYMELEIANKGTGQFFTPPALSELMAHMTFGDELVRLHDQPFITVQEPACGAGGMVLALVKVMIDAGHNPADKLWVQCIDVDRMAALMCFVQLTLWHVPAEIVVGNTLTLETQEVWHTPAHHLGFWSSKLKRDKPSTTAPLSSDGGGDKKDSSSGEQRPDDPEQLSLF